MSISSIYSLIRSLTCDSFHIYTKAVHSTQWGEGGREEVGEGGGQLPPPGKLNAGNFFLT